ncbi:MAG: hypothetical protein HC800_21695 [Phormidesmis sp. RL_2_1]|nr:hypothetical protein [Phormidesmis sp. RL_2_1]
MLTAILARPAAANCAGGPPIEPINQAALERLNRIRDDRSYFFGQEMIDSVEGNVVILTAAFDAFTGPDKQQILRQLELEGSSYLVRAADGRLLSAQYDPCTTRVPLLTERDRFGWYLNRSPVNLPYAQLGEALRNAGNPSWRRVTTSISPTTERQIRLQFWQRVGYTQYNQGWWIAWVPEGGYFEITVVRADDLALANRFIENASQDYNYVVLASDGTRLADTRYSRGNPWQWLLAQVSLPAGWQLSPCDPSTPFLCVQQDNETVGSIEIQRWEVSSYPDFLADILNADLTPGLMTYDNPEHTEKVRAALKTQIEDYYETIRTDRLTTYGTRYAVITKEPESTHIGNLPGLTYGFSSVTKTGEVVERYVGYIAYNGNQHLYFITTGYDPLAESSTFAKLASLEQFEPYLKSVVEGLHLPHPNW